MSAPTATTTPIADLSYRNYDGPIRRHPVRWWIIARAHVRTTTRRWGFWALAAATCLPWLVLGAIIYFQMLAYDQAMKNAPPEFAAMVPLPEFVRSIVTAYGQTLFWMFFLSLLVGAGSIAGDNRANALQIYLSKPLLKRDYVIGKWIGVFLPLTVAGLVPALMFYLFCLTSYTEYGFPRSPLMFVRLVGTIALAGAVFTSLVVGFSSWYRSSVVAGGIYAGVYYALLMLSAIGTLILVLSGYQKAAATVAHLSIGGMLNGIAQHVFNARALEMGPRRMTAVEPPMPELWPLVLVAVLVVVGGIMAARMRIRAVEVVRG